MVRRVYILPATRVASGPGSSAAVSRTPSNVGRGADAVVTGVYLRGMDYGLQPVFLALCEVDAAQHGLIAAQQNVTVIPANLSGTVGAGARAAVEAALEGWKIPGNWVTAAMTYRQVLKGVATIFQIAQRLHGMFGVEAFPSGVTLSTTMAQLTQGQRNALQAVVDSFGWDRSSITGATTMRQFLRAMAQQWTWPIVLGSESLG